MKTIGFIGCGNMAQAMIAGILGKNLFDCKHIFVSDVNQNILELCRSNYNIQLADNNVDLCIQSDYIVLSVKPQNYPDVIAEIKDTVISEKIIIMIGAGQTISLNEKRFAHPVKLIRVMPNTPALVGEGMTAVSPNSLINDGELQEVLKIFNSFGKALCVPEKMMDAVTAVSGSSPAFVYMFVEALASGAVAEGMPWDLAYTFASQAVLGSAKMLLETQEHPGVLKDKVCSPGGTTIEAVASLEASGFKSSVIKAVRDCSKKSAELTKNASK